MELIEYTHKVLILEDDPHRIRAFKTRFVDDLPSDIIYEVTITPFVHEAITFLSEDVFDLVFLDHDLSIKKEDGTWEELKESGSHLTAWLEQHPEVAKRHKQYLSHSINYAGRNNMIAALRSIGILCLDTPFLWEPSIFWKYEGLFRRKHVV